MGRSNIKSVPFSAVITQMFVILFKRDFICYFLEMRVRSQSSSLRLTQRGRAGRKHSVQSSIFHINPLEPPWCRNALLQRPQQIFLASNLVGADRTEPSSTTFHVRKRSPLRISTLLGNLNVGVLFGRFRSVTSGEHFCLILVCFIDTSF